MSQRLLLISKTIRMRGLKSNTIRHIFVKSIPVYLTSGGSKHTFLFAEEQNNFGLGLRWHFFVSRLLYKAVRSYSRRISASRNKMILLNKSRPCFSEPCLQRRFNYLPAARERGAQVREEQRILQLYILYTVQLCCNCSRERVSKLVLVVLALLLPSLCLQGWTPWLHPYCQVHPALLKGSEVPGRARQHDILVEY